MKTLRFYKDPDIRWYVDLPEWTGTKAELEMVAGADTMLEYMAEGSDEVTLSISEEPFEGGDSLVFKELAIELGNGAYYYFENYRGITINLDIWLCDVVKFVFGDFPKILYVSHYENI